MNRLALLLATTTFFVTAQPAFPQDTPSFSFSGNPGICLIKSPAEPQLVPGTEEWNFRTRIRDGTRGACADFDGAFKVVTWGCGTECEGGVMVDLTDGKVYWLPDVASYGYEYHAESNLLVVNAFILQSMESSDVPANLWREYYLFAHGKWTLISQDKGFSPGME